METLIEYLISDFQARILPPIKPRAVRLPNIEGKIDTIVGMRRTGKTYFLYQIIQEKLQAGFPKEGILYFNFDDKRLMPLKVGKLNLITETYYRLFPEFKRKKCFFFFDEIQNIIGWERYVRRLLDTENVHITLSGSSSKLLSKEIATHLRGRAIATEIFPFSFPETLQYENPTIQIKEPPNDHLRSWMSNRIRDYLSQGGFPEVQAIDELYRLQILQEYVGVVILRDVIERYKVTNIQALDMMVQQLLSVPATLFSVNKFYNDLRSQGIRCTKNALYEYLDYLIDAYLVYPVSIHTRSQRIRRLNPRKIYAIDTGLAYAFLHRPQIDWGRQLETFVYNELRRKNLKIEYYRTKEETEVDFITTSLQGELALFQVCLELNDPKIRQRKIKTLETAMQECRLRLKEAKIITLDHREIIETKNGIIEVIPAWYWSVYRK